MNKQELVFAFALGGALIATWLFVRIGARAPQTGKGIAAHSLAALGTTALVPFLMQQVGTADSTPRAIGAMLGLVLPMFVYNFVTWLWLLRLLQRRLHVG
jgi:hypothetical protein